MLYSANGAVALILEISLCDACTSSPQQLLAPFVSADPLVGTFCLGRWKPDYKIVAVQRRTCKGRSFENCCESPSRARGLFDHLPLSPGLTSFRSGEHLDLDTANGQHVNECDSSWRVFLKRGPMSRFPQIVEGSQGPQGPLAGHKRSILNQWKTRQARIHMSPRESSCVCVPGHGTRRLPRTPMML